MSQPPGHPPPYRPPHQPPHQPPPGRPPYQPPYQYQPPQPWQRPDARPGTVTAAGVLTIVLGALGLLGSIAAGVLVASLGFFIDALGESKGGSSADTEAVAPLFVGVAIGVAVIGVLVSALYVLLGVRVLRRGTVARVLLTIWNGLSILAGLGSTVAALTQQDVTQTPGLVFSAMTGLVFPATVLVLLWTGSANAWFAGRSGPPAGPPPGPRPG